jgi:adenylate kinase
MMFAILAFSMNIPTTIIVMGRSGSGKGTQIALLKEFLENHNQLVYHFESGNLFREMIQSKGYTPDKLREFLNSGKLVPDFLTDWLLVNNLVNNLKNQDQILVLDGYPRTLNQVATLEDTLKYYGRTKVTIIHVEVSEQEVRRRMLERGRSDDLKVKSIENRIHFYNETVIPTLEILRNKDKYTVIDINGEGEVDDIQESIRKNLTIK